MTDTAPWYAHYDELVRFAGVLVAAGWLETPGEVVFFFEQPWRWRRVYRAWEASGRPWPDSGVAWRTYVALIEAAEARGRL
jgi:hypothetical protein